MVTKKHPKPETREIAGLVIAPFGRRKGARIEAPDPSVLSADECRQAAAQLMAIAKWAESAGSKHE